MTEKYFILVRVTNEGLGSLQTRRKLYKIVTSCYKRNWRSGTILGSSEHEGTEKGMHMIFTPGRDLLCDLSEKFYVTCECLIYKKI